MGASAQTPARVEDMRTLHGGLSATGLVGARVRSSDGKDVGEIEDLIFSADARVVTAIVSVGGVLDVADKLVAVPYADLRVWSDDKTLAIPLTAAAIEAAPPYRADPLAVGEARPVVDPERAAPPDEATRREADQEAQRVFAGNDPRVADGIAENEKAFEDEEAQPEDAEPQSR
jgi:hypothetical protein